MASKYELDDRVQAAIAWLITGNSEEAGRLCGIPGRTIRDWMQTEWWADVLEQAKGIKQKELDALWTGIIHKAADELRDRIINGDEVLTKSGDVKRLKLKGKDLSIIMAYAVDKRAMGRGQATSRTEKITTEQKLEKIADKLEQIGSKKANESDEPSIQ